MLKTLVLAEEPVYSDSLSAIRALQKPRITSELIRECKEELNELAGKRPVCLTWIQDILKYWAMNGLIS